MRNKNSARARGGERGRVIIKHPSYRKNPWLRRITMLSWIRESYMVHRPSMTDHRREKEILSKTTGDANEELIGYN